MKLNFYHIKTFILSLIIICSSTLPAIHGENSYGKNNEELCYGLIISYVKIDNLSIECHINEDINHMINDFLRENISVYWTAESVNITIKEINNPDERTMTFSKGSFIVPFRKDTNYDIKLMTIISEYNQSSKIVEDREYKVPVFLLSEPFVIKVYPLNRVRIANYRDLISGCDFLYFEAATAQGFLDFEFLDFNELKHKLDYKDFNICVCPGAGAAYVPKEKVFLKFTIMLLQDVLSGSANAVRDFVGKGGGYVGSCYGAYKAACSVNSFPIYMKRRPYNVDLKSIGIFAISDIITKNPDPKILGSTEIKIVDNNHPLTYSILEDTVIDHHYGGPVITYVGDNSHTIGEFYNTGSFADGNASWVSSDFGKGKAIIFSPHPELVAVLGSGKEAEIGKRLVSNSFFYTTSEEKKDIDVDTGYNLTYIEGKFDEIEDILIPESATNHVFNLIKKQINETIDDINLLIDNTSMILDSIYSIADEKGVDLGDRKNKFYLGYDLVKDTYYSYKLFKKHLLDSLNILNRFEKIYSLNENNSNLITKIGELKTLLKEKLNETKLIFDDAFKIFKKYNLNLNKFRDSKLGFIKNIFESFVSQNMRKMYFNSREMFDSIPQIYLNSLKSIRNAWYNYESEILS